MPLPDLAIEHVALYFRALSEPMRLRIINRLRSSPCSVGELTECLGCSQANISKHLKVLVDVGIVAREVHGTAARLCVADPSIDTLCALVCESVSRDLERQLAVQQALRQADSDA